MSRNEKERVRDRQRERKREKKREGENVWISESWENWFHVWSMSSTAFLTVSRFCIHLIIVHLSVFFPVANFNIYFVDVNCFSGIIPNVFSHIHTISIHLHRTATDIEADEWDKENSRKAKKK